MGYGIYVIFLIVGSLRLSIKLMKRLYVYYVNFLFL